MKTAFAKYHALLNDFLVLEAKDARLKQDEIPDFAIHACERNAGIGADGILYLSKSDTADCKIDVYNADGSWAEKSGNGLRIAAAHVHRKDRRTRNFSFETANSVDETNILGSDDRTFSVRVSMGQPSFETKSVPMKSSAPHHIHTPLTVGGLDFPVTCLSVGNPHCVLFVDNFDFDWEELGYEIEHHPAFPERTNVEFVKVVTRKKIKVAEWERGAGPTGSSGTGAAAAVCAAVMLGQAERTCSVEFEPGTLEIHWNEQTDLIELTGPVELVAEGTIYL